MKRYFCPYCDARTTLWSITPVLTDEWVCKGCKRRSLLDVVAIADNWENTLAAWAALPLLALVEGGLLWAFHEDWKQVLLVLFVAAPMIWACALVTLCLLLKPVEWVAGAWIKAKNAHKQRRHKAIIREVE
jgi:hypothetical protein